MLADDSGLEVDALGSRPGVRSARYHQAAPGGDGCAALLAELAGVAGADRGARFRCLIALAAPDGQERLFEGICEGAIGIDKRGPNGFGFDPVFVPARESRHLAEMRSEEKHAISHRGIAMRRLLHDLMHVEAWRGGDVISNLVSRMRAEVDRVLSAEFAGRGDSLLVAVSGGPDSLCLADAALALAPERGLRVTIAHLDHSLRGQAGRDDAEFVRSFADERGVPCVVDVADVAALARDRKVSIEVAARDARYAFLARAAGQCSARAVALAHHADDQAETVLLRLLRGTGAIGLRGMQVRGPLPGDPGLIALRPLLRVTRADIDQYCRDQKLQPRHDATNDERQHARNRIRHELLPILEQYNPNIRAALARLADTIEGEVEIVEAAARDAFDRIAAVETGAVRIDRPAWRALSIGLQRETLREAVRRLHGDATNLPYAAVEEARDVLNSDAGAGEIALMGDLRIAVRWREFVLSTRR